MWRPRKSRKFLKQLLKDTVKENYQLRERVALLERQILKLRKSLYADEKVYYCSKCKRRKHDYEFDNRKSAKNGKQNYCRACKNAYLISRKEVKNV